LEQPAYMGNRRSKPSMSRIASQAAVMWGRLRGERFNTPSLARKRWLERRVSQSINHWRDLERTRGITRGDGRKVLLLPLQMQPEANIDCWGAESLRDQAQFISAVSALLPSDWKLWVKGNPHAKYELVPKLFQTIGTCSNVELVNWDTQMSSIWQDVSMVLTVTGTVSIEALFSGKPVYLMSQFLSQVMPRFPTFGGLDGLRTYLVDRHDLLVCPAAARVELMRNLYCESYDAILSNWDDSTCRAPANFVKLIDAFRDVLGHLASQRATGAEVV
jgi:hypothetical protein